ncbi:MAG: cobalamin biosynthesis protein [Lachnospiraceae bacterium]|nr:cobalamin biosynthesis protein [Lachnospiraceae bacterium]
MDLSIISFTENGIRLSVKLSEKIEEKLQKTGNGNGRYPKAVRLFTKCADYGEKTGANGRTEQKVSVVPERIGVWAGEQMEQKNALLFIGACGIAVRAIAPHVTDKLHDSPVLVMDEKGQYVIPILSGHVGGANELALWIAGSTGAEPVITTATDVNGAFAVDLFAKKNGLSIVNPDGIAKVSSRVLAGQSLTVSVETGHCEKDGKLPEGIQMTAYPPAKRVDVVITSENREFDTALLLKPREYIIGMGCRRGKEAAKIEALICRTLEQEGISVMQAAALASIDVKRDEPGLLAWSRKEKLPFLTYTAEELQGVRGAFQGSDFVKEQVGIDNVCERAALKAAGPDGVLVYGKHAEDGITIAIARKEWKVDFEKA